MRKTIDKLAAMVVGSGIGVCGAGALLFTVGYIGFGSSAPQKASGMVLAATGAAMVAVGMGALLICQAWGED